MLKSSAAYRAAITGDTRSIKLRAVLDLTDPDIVYSPVDGCQEASWSQSDQLHDRTFDLTPYATLERGRWRLDGSFDLLPAQAETATGERGYVGAELSREDGTFPLPTYISMRISRLEVLQSCTICFSPAPYDGVAEQFWLELRGGGVCLHQVQIRDNRAARVTVDGFMVSNVDTIQITIDKWSLPGRRMRVVEIIPGVWEEWSNAELAEFDCSQVADFSSMSLPYGTCDLSFDNRNRRFDARNPDGLYQSIEERQGIQISVGAVLPDGMVEYKPLGTYYHYSGGWQDASSTILMHWHLVDILGLLSRRRFILPDPRPKTLGTWVAAVAAQLGPALKGRYRVDPTYADKPLILQERADMDDVTCGAVLRWACQAAGTFARASSDGLLTVEPYWDQGCLYTLDNLTDYPAQSANGVLDAIIFTLFDGQRTQLAISGTTSAGGQTISVKNPFIHTEGEARAAARQILSQYGGTRLALVGRGDPSAEVGDVATVELDSSHAATGRVQEQSFTVKGGVLQGCKTQLLQATGAMLYSKRTVMQQSGTWTVPPGVTSIRLILVGHGAAGNGGTDGTWEDAGVDGTPGQGGKVWHAHLNVTPGSTFGVNIGPAAELGGWTSADGMVYPTGFTDIDSGESYGRTGVADPLRGYGDGGAGGRGGVRGIKHIRHGEEIVDAPPSRGDMGIPGGSGCAIIYWEPQGGEREQWPLTFRL